MTKRPVRPGGGRLSGPSRPERASRPDRAALRDALLDAAEQAIARDGFGALRARALTEAVGCALGALYTVFADMDALILAVKLRILDRLDARAAARLDAVPDAPGRPADAIPLAMAEAYLAFAFDERRAWEVLFQHHLAGGADLPDWYRERLGDTFARIAGPLRLALPALSEAAALRLAHTLFAAVHGVVVLGLERKLGHPSRREIEGRVTMLIRSAVAGVRQDPALAAEGADRDAAQARPRMSILGESGPRPR